MIKSVFEVCQCCLPEDVGDLDNDTGHTATGAPSPTSTIPYHTNATVRFLSRSPRGSAHTSASLALPRRRPARAPAAAVRGQHDMVWYEKRLPASQPQSTRACGAPVSFVFLLEEFRLFGWCAKSLTALWLVCKVTDDKLTET